MIKVQIQTHLKRRNLMKEAIQMHIKKIADRFRRVESSKKVENLKEVVSQKKYLIANN